MNGSSFLVVAPVSPSASLPERGSGDIGLRVPDGEEVGWRFHRDQRAHVEREGEHQFNEEVAAKVEEANVLLSLACGRISK